MVSKARAKGYRTVSKGKKILESKGYICANLEKTGKFAKEKDLFNLWDFLAIKGKLHLFIQFKTNESFGIKKPRKWIHPYIDFGKTHCSKYVKYQIWNKTDYKGFEVFKCKNDKKRTI